MTENRNESGGNRGLGMNWIRPEKRLAIYLRDGLACVYCGASVEEEAKLTLDHVIPRSIGGSNQTENLVTACIRCNSARGNRTLPKFAAAAADYLNHGLTPKAILGFVRTTTARPIDVAAAKELISRRGGFSLALSAK